VSITTLHGDCRELLRGLDAGSVQTIVTSPPYWRLRKYTDDPREIGQEATPAEYVEALRAVFAECRRVLRDDGTLWLNLGDSYTKGQTSRRKASRTSDKLSEGHVAALGARVGVPDGLTPKSLIGLPWRVAFALQDDGWVLRSEIIWEKPNAMPESVTDRPTRSHEHLFLFAASPRYYYDHKAIAERAIKGASGSTFTQGKTGVNGLGRVSQKPRIESEERNARTVWSIPTSPLADEHYAPMPQALAERCIKAGSRPGDAVLDPFGGSGTTGRAAVALQRRAVLIDLGYQELQGRRLDGVQITMTDLDAA
jgi:DNA modification methylase